MIQRGAMSCPCRRRVVSGVTSNPSGGRGEAAGERGDQCLVGPGHRGSRDAATLYGELVAEDEDLRVFGRVGSCEQSYLAHELADHQIRQSHGPRSDHAQQWLLPNLQVTYVGRVSGTHRAVRHQSLRP